MPSTIKIMKLLPLLFCSLIALPSAAQRRTADPRLNAILDMKDAAALQDTLRTLENSKAESDLQLLLNYYNGTRNTDKKEEIAEVISQRFPNGRAAFNVLGERIYAERDPAENEKNYREMVARFGSRPEFNLDGSRYFVAVTFLGKNRPQKVMEYLSMIQNKEYKTNAFSYAARESIAAKDYKLGEKLIRKTFADLKGDTTHKGMDEFFRIFSELLYANGKYEEGFPHAKRIYEKQSRATSATVVQLKATYLNYLVQLNRYNEAYPDMVELMKNGAATPLIKERFKAAYVAVNGSDKGFFDLTAEINKAFSEKIKEEVAKTMVNKPAYDFELKDLAGKTVKLSDFKGKVVVLDFWATWCAPCKASFPNMQEAVNRYKNDKDVVFLFIHTMEKAPDAAKAAGDYIRDMKYTFNVLMDLKDPETKKNTAAVNYMVKGIPCKIVIDGAGSIRFTTIGNTAAGSDAFHEEMDAMINMARG